MFPDVFYVTASKLAQRRMHMHTHNIDRVRSRYARLVRTEAARLRELQATLPTPAAPATQ